MDPLDRLLASLRWRFVRRERRRLAAGEWSEHPPADPMMLLVTGGKLRLRVRQCWCELADGDFVLFPRTQRFELHALSDASVLEIGIAPLGGESAVRALPERLLLTDMPQHEPLATAMLRQVAEECTDPGGVLGDRGVTWIASKAISAWHARGCAPQRWLTEVDDPGVARALAAVHADPGRMWTVEALSRIALASRSGFAERFRAATGQTPGRYLTAVRIEHAQHMLAADDTSVAEVARTLGFGSPTAFGRAFRRQTGRTPTQWRHAAGPSFTQERRPASATCAT